MTRRVFAADILPPNVDGLPLLRPVGGRRLRFASFGEISVTTVPSVRVCLILLFPLLPSSSFKLVLFLLLLLTLDMERFFAAGLRARALRNCPRCLSAPVELRAYFWEARVFGGANGRTAFGLTLFATLTFTVLIPFVGSFDIVAMP